MTKPNITGQTFPVFDLLYAALILVFPLLYFTVVIDPVVTPRQVFWAVMIASIVMIMLFRKQPRIFHFTDPLVICIALMPCLYMLSIIQSISTVESVYTVSKWILYSTFPLITSMLLLNGGLRRETILKCVILVGAFACAATVYQMIQVALKGINIFKEYNLYEVRATFGHKNLLSSMLFLCLPFCITAFFIFKSLWKWASVAVIAVSTVLILLLQTRAVLAGVLLSFFITTAIALWVLRKAPELRRIRMIALCLLLLFIAGASVVMMKRDVFSLVTRTESMRERINLWHNTVQMIKENPLAGVGAGNWQIHFPKYGLVRFYDTNYLISEGLTNFQRPHNDFLWVFAETGIIGFVVYLFIFILALAYLVRLLGRAEGVQQKLIMLAWMFAWTGYAVIACFDFPLERMEHQLMLGLLLAFIISEKQKTFPGPVKQHVPSLALIAVAALAMFSAWVGVKRFEGEKHSYKMIVAHQHNVCGKMISEGKKAVNSFYNMDPFSIPITWYIGVGQFTQGDLTAAKESFEEAYRLHPYQVHVLNNYATCFEKEGQRDKAIALFEEMYRISPIFSDGIVNLSGSYFNAGRYEDAYRVMSTFKWDEQNPRSHEFIAAIMGKKMEIMLAGDYPKETKERIASCMQDDKCILRAFKESQQKKLLLHEYLVAGF